MKVVPIKNFNQTVFQGLWGKTYERPAGHDGHINNVEMVNIYHPFANESQSAIESAIAAKKYSVLVPTENEYEFNNVISEPKVAKKLPFTEQEFNLYKRSYGKELPESIKNIEENLVNRNLSKYLNNKFISTIKKFLSKV